MAILLNDNLDIAANKPVDNRYGPYATVALAISGIPSFKRHIGLTVGIGLTNTVDYWFKAGTGDTDLIEKVPTVNVPVTSVAGKTGAVTLVKADVGLGNVDNTSDANKPVSTATQTALDAKQATLVSGTTIKTINGNSLLGAGDIAITGGGGSGNTNLSYTASATGGTVLSDTGNDATLTLADTTNAGLMSPADKTKLNGVATNANNYTHPNHTGDVTSAGDGATAIGNNVVTNAKLAQIAANTIKGRATTGTGNVEDLTAAQVRTILNVADGATANAAATVTPQPLGTAAVGTATAYARADHVHALPTASAIGAQATLVSGTNIKSINGTSLLGSGDISIGSGGTQVNSDWEATTGVAQILNKPTEFNPSSHSHTPDQISSDYYGNGNLYEDIEYIDGLLGQLQIDVSNNRLVTPAIISSNATLVSGRWVHQRVQNLSASSLTITLPTSPTAGDRFIISSTGGVTAVTQPIIIRRRNWTTTGTGDQFTTLATITAVNQEYQFTTQASAQQGWYLDIVETHTHFQPDPETLPDEQSGVTVVTTPSNEANGLLLPRIGDGSYGMGDEYASGRTAIERLLPSQAGGVSNQWEFKQWVCSSEDCTDRFSYVSTSPGVYPWLATWPAGVSLIKGQLPRVGWADLSPTRNEGTSSYAARADHSHPFPTAQQVGAAPATHSHADATTSTAGFLSAEGKAKLDISLDPSLFDNSQTRLPYWTTPVPISHTGKLLYSILPRLLRSGATFSPFGIKNGYLEWRSELFGTRQEIFFAPSSPSLTWTDASPPAGTPSSGSRPPGDVWSLIPSIPTSEALYGVPLRGYVPYNDIGTSPSGQPSAGNPSLRGGIVPVSGTSETRRVRQFVITGQAATLAYVIDYPQTGDAASGPEQLELWYANSRSTGNGAFVPFTSNSILYRRIAVLGPTTDFTFAPNASTPNTPSFRVVQNSEDSESGAFVSRSVVATATVNNVESTAVAGPLLYPVWNKPSLGTTKSTEMGVLEFPASAGLVLSSVEPTSQNDWRTLEWKAAASHTHPVGNLTQSGATTGQVIKWNGTAWAPAGDSGGAGATNLSYTASATGGTVVSDTGNDATLSLADTTNAGLMSPADKTKLNGLTGPYADLVNGKVPESQLPSYVDDVVECATQGARPQVGQTPAPETGKIYVTLDDNKCWRWTGTTYIEISPSSGQISAVAGLQEALNSKQTTIFKQATIPATANNQTFLVSTYYPGNNGGDLRRTLTTITFSAGVTAGTTIIRLPQWLTTGLGAWRGDQAFFKFQVPSGVTLQFQWHNGTAWVDLAKFNFTGSEYWSAYQATIETETHVIWDRFSTLYGVRDLFSPRLGNVFLSESQVGPYLEPNNIYNLTTIQPSFYPINLNPGKLGDRIIVRHNGPANLQFTQNGQTFTAYSGSRIGGAVDNPQIEFLCGLSGGALIWNDVTPNGVVRSVAGKTGNVTLAVGDITQSGATTGQVIKWNGTSWAPGDDTGGSGGGMTWSTVPATATATGTAGQMAYADNYLYVCVATNVWKRTILATW